MSDDNSGLTRRTALAAGAVGLASAGAAMAAQPSGAGGSAGTEDGDFHFGPLLN